MSSQVRRKQDQLCRQVEERLGLVFAGDIDDPLLQELYVAGVEPEPDGVNLVVRLALPRPDISAVAVLQRLTALRTFLRAEIAAAIHRKRAPGLLFRVEHGLPGAEEEEDEP
jgi:ribosome-binding factor A